MILIVTQTFAPAVGGMEVYLTELAEELAQAGRDVFVFADGKASSFVPQAPYKISRFSGWRPLRRWKKRRAIAALVKLGAIEGIFCDSWKSVSALPRNLSVPIVVLGHGMDFPSSPSSEKRRRIENNLSRATSILANSHYTAGRVRPFLPNPNDPRLQIVHPPIRPMPDPSLEAVAELRAIIGAKSPVIVTLARFEPRKGVDRVIEALPEIKLRYPNILYLIGGGGPDEPRLRALAQEKGVADNVVFFGYAVGDRKRAFLSSADVFAMPVRQCGASVEGFGISYIEAAWYGIPSLGGQGSGAADAILDGQTGLLCDGDNLADVTAKLLRLLDDSAFRQTLGCAAQERVKDQMLWSRALPSFLSALGRRA